MHGRFFARLDRVMMFLDCRFLIQNSAAVRVLFGGEDPPFDGLQIGQLFQAVWFEAARRCLALQPLGTTLFLQR
jgi:hypothetical protein